MRFSNWDVLLFPEDSRVPIQEFEVKCQAIPQSLESAASDRLILFAGNSHQTSVTHVPTLTCFVSSLEHGHPFRVSIHSWEKPRPSDLLQSFRPLSDRVIFQARLYIDGQMKAQRHLAVQNIWPEVIDTITSNDYTKPLRFPPFHTEILQQSHWDAGDSLGRIRVVIAEGISQSDEFGNNHSFDNLRDIVAFSFQHAPKHILEYSGIAWPNARMFTAALPGSGSSNFDAHAHSPRRPSASRTYNGNQSARKLTAADESSTVRGHQWPHTIVKSRSVVEDPFTGPALNTSSHRQSRQVTDVSMHNAATRSKGTSEMSGVMMEQPDAKQCPNLVSTNGAIRLSTPPPQQVSALKAQSVFNQIDLGSSLRIAAKPTHRNYIESSIADEALSRSQSAFGQGVRPEPRESRRSASNRSGNMSWEETPTLGCLWSSVSNDYPGLLPSLHSSNGKNRSTSAGSKRKRSLSPTTLLPTEGDLQSHTKGMSTSPCKESFTPTKTEANNASPPAIIACGKS